MAKIAFKKSCEFPIHMNETGKTEIEKANEGDIYDGILLSDSSPTEYKIQFGEGSVGLIPKVWEQNNWIVVCIDDCDEIEES